VWSGWCCGAPAAPPRPSRARPAPSRPAAASATPSRPRPTAALPSEVFVALRARAVDDLGPATAEFCDACHRPESGRHGGALGPDGQSDGLSCVSCHAARGNLGVKNGQLLHDLDGPVRGPVRPPGVRSAATGELHPTRASEYLQSADLCGTCHEVDGPAGFSEAPYTHWRASPAAAEGTSCQACHFAAPFGHAPGDLDALASTVARLTLLGVDADGVDVELAHQGTGHPLPDGASFLRTLDVVARWPGGEARAGLAARLWLGADEVVVPSEADRVEVRALQPGERRRLRLEGRVPAGAEVEVCLEHRRFRPELLVALGLEASLGGAARALVCVR
jgi:hypothetical protein